MKKMNWKKNLALAASAALTLSLLTGCGASQSPAAQSVGAPAASGSEAAGTVLLSVNPEIEVEYDKGGLVLEIEGVNDDGKSVVTGLEDYKGKDCRAVVNELVKKIYESGYFSETVDGRAKNIVVKLEEGSSYPGDGFLEDVAEGVWEAVKTCGIGSAAMTVQQDDLDGEGRIGQHRAKELVLAQLGLSGASFNDHEYELDDGVYEFEFTAGGVEYEYEVDARTGKVLEADIDGNDDWDGRDDWDDWGDFDSRDDDDDDDDDNDGLDDNDDHDDDLDDDDDGGNAVSIPVGDDDDDGRDDDDDQDDDDDDSWDDIDDQDDGRDDIDDQDDNDDDQDDDRDDDQDDDQDSDDDGDDD